MVNIVYMHIKYTSMFIKKVIYSKIMPYFYMTSVKYVMNCYTALYPCGSIILPIKLLLYVEFFSNIVYVVFSTEKFNMIRIIHLKGFVIRKRLYNFVIFDLCNNFIYIYTLLYDIISIMKFICTHKTILLKFITIFTNIFKLKNYYNIINRFLKHM